MNCKCCNEETKDRAGKLFCSRNCKIKYKYHNNDKFKQHKIDSSVEFRRKKIKHLNELTPEDINKLKLIRPELFK